MQRLATMSDSEVDYLQPDFDPSTVTMPRLRSILVTHNVSYSATAKKQQLVDIFNSEIAPKAKKILAQRARAKRSSLGIVDAQPQDTDSFDQDLMPPPSTRRSRSPRKISHQRAHEPEPERPSPKKRAARSSSRQLQASDTDTAPELDVPRLSRRPSRRAEPARAKLEDSDDDIFKQAHDDDSVFTDDNPFQSGGSSPPVVKTPANRRKTTGIETKSGAPSTRRRRTDGPAVTDTIDSKISKTFEIPVSTLTRHKTPEPPVIEAGEEFTPQEQLELEEMVAKGETSVVSRNTTQATRRRVNLATPIWVLVLTLLGAYAAWYRQEKVAVGYCGLGRSPTQVLPPNVPVPDWAVPFIEPQCEPCPQHAYCYTDYSVRCENDFILKPHPLSLGGLVPLPPTCEPDGEKVRRVKAVADKAVEELRERRAQWECGDLVNDEGEEEDSPAISEEELKEIVSQKRSKRLGSKEFDDLWIAALGEVKEREEIEVVQ